MCVFGVFMGAEVRSLRWKYISQMLGNHPLSECVYNTNTNAPKFCIVCYIRLNACTRLFHMHFETYHYIVCQQSR